MTIPHMFLLLTAGALLLPDRRQIRLAGLGLTAFALAAASWRVVPGESDPARLGLSLSSTRLPLAFIRLNAGLLLLGLALPAAAVVSTMGGNRITRVTLARAAPLAVVLLVVLVKLWPVMPAVGVLTTIVVAGGLGLGWLAAVGAFRLLRVAPALNWIDRQFAPRSPPLVKEYGWIDRIWLAVAVVAALAALRASEVRLVFGAILTLGVAGHALARRRGAIGWFPGLPILLLPLAPALTLIDAIASPGPLTFGALRGAPFSPPAEVALAALLAIPAWAFAGLWPFHLIVPGPLLAPIAGVVLGRVGVGLVPDGVVHWQPLLAALSAVAISHAAATRRHAGVLAALGMLGLSSVLPVATRGGDWLLACACGGVVLARSRYLIPATLRPWGRLLWLIPAWAGLSVLDGGLRTEVFFTVVAVAAVAAGIWLSLTGTSDVDPPPGSVHICRSTPSK